MNPNMLNLFLLGLIIVMRWVILLTNLVLATTSSHIPATAADMIATVLNVVVVPKGKEYNQLVFHSFTGVMAAVWDLTCATCRKTNCGTPKQKTLG